MKTVSIGQFEKMFASSILCVTLMIAEFAVSTPVPNDAPMDSSITTIISGVQNRTKLSILATINYGGNFFPAGPHCSKAIELALDRLHLEPGFLFDKYRLSFDLVDDKWDDATVIKLVLSELLYSSHRLPVFILNHCPTRGQQVLAQIIKHQNILGFSYYPAEGHDPIDRQDSKLIQLLLPSLMRNYDGVVNLIRHFGWRNLAVFSEFRSYFNEVETFLFKLFDRNNITVYWMDKVHYMSTDADEMNSAVIDMKRHDPRIIFSNTDSPVSVSCWFYKHGLYGPDHVIIGTTWGNFNAETVTIPDYISSWCTRDILKEVQQSWIYFGDTLMTDIFGQSYTDSTGLSIPEFKKAMYKKVAEPNFENIFMWKFYDATLFVGKAVDAGFKIAKDRNMSLGELITSPGIFEEAAFSIRINGTKAVYDIDPIIKSNTEGYGANTFAQKRLINGSLGNSIFGYFKSDQGHYYDLHGGPVWRTVDGNPPKDQVHYVAVIQPANSLAVVISLTVLASIASATSIAVCVYITLKLTSSESLFSVFVLIGNVVIMSHVYFIPYTSNESNTINLFMISLLLLSGFSISNLCFLFKLQEAHQALHFNKMLNLKKSLRSYTQHVLLLSWLGLNMGQVVALNLDSAFIVTERYSDNYISSDGNTIFEPYQLEFAFLPNSMAVKIFAIAVAVIHIAIILVQVFVSYQITAKCKEPAVFGYFYDLNVIGKIKTDCWTAYYQCLFLIAAAVAMITAMDNAERLTILIAVFTIFHCGLYTANSHFKKMYLPGLTEGEQRKIRRQRRQTANADAVHHHMHYPPGASRISRSRIVTRERLS